MARDRDAATTVRIWLLFFILLVPVGAVGWAIGHSTKGGSETTTSAATGSTASLAVAAIGDPAKGQAMFVSKHCSDCHSYNGHGGTDAPPLDSMRGQLSAREIAGMSGTIWNHLPMMLPHFKEEGIPLPSFTQAEMADLIAYLHGGPPSGGAKMMTSSTATTGMHMGTSTGMNMTSTGMNMSTTTGMKMSSRAVDKGKQLFMARGCGTCHTFAAADSSGAIGPDLDKTLMPDAKKAKQTLAAFVQESIIHPNAYIAAGFHAGVMPESFGRSLSDGQIASLVAFLTQKQS